MLHGLWSCGTQKKRPAAESRMIGRFFAGLKAHASTVCRVAKTATRRSKTTAFVEASLRGNRVSELQGLKPVEILRGLCRGPSLLLRVNWKPRPAAIRGSDHSVAPTALEVCFAMLSQRFRAGLTCAAPPALGFSFAAVFPAFRSRTSKKCQGCARSKVSGMPPAVYCAAPPALGFSFAAVFPAFRSRTNKKCQECAQSNVSGMCAAVHCAARPEPISWG